MSETLDDTLRVGRFTEPRTYRAHVRFASATSSTDRERDTRDTRRLVNAPENPRGCYGESRFGSREEMVREIMTVFDPPPFR